MLILINVHYLQNVVFNFGKDSSGQTQSLSDFLYLIEKYPLPQVNFPGQRARFVKVCFLIPS